MSKRADYSADDLALVIPAIDRIFRRYRERATALCGTHGYSVVVEDLARFINQRAEGMHSPNGGYEVRKGQQLAVWRAGYTIGEPPTVTIPLTAAIMLIFSDPHTLADPQPSLWDYLTLDQQARELGS